MVKSGQHLLVASLVCAAALTGCFGHKKATPAAGTSAEPDKVLYARAMDDFKHGRYSVGRLALDTLINTYPDSEYLAKAKLATADSYYKEGGMSGLKQAIAQYKDFETFFPFLDEAAYAQMQVAMAHYRQMEKPDRDRTEALDAEAELQTFLQKYPNNELYGQAEQRLREVQEVLAEGDFRIAQFYYIRGAGRAAAVRLIELTNRYRLYSQADRANWMLAQLFVKGEKKDIAASYYARIVRDYPLSPLAAEAKTNLSKLGFPVPQPDPVAVARMEKERVAEKARPGMLHRSMGVIKGAPDVTMAAHTGEPSLSPESDAGDLSLAALPASDKPGSIGGAAGTTAVVQTVQPGTSAPAASGSTSGSAENPPAAGSSTESNVGVSVISPTGANPPAPTASGTTSGTAASSTTTDPAAPAPAPTAAAQPAPSTGQAAPADPSKESTSKKKKKGLRKLIPW